MKRSLFWVFLSLFALESYAQKNVKDISGFTMGVKTNLLYWGTVTPNIGAELRLAKKWTLDIEAGLNPFDGKNDDGSYGKSIKHFRLHPEIRYWFCESFYGHFLGLHVPYLYIMCPTSNCWVRKMNVIRDGELELD